MICAFVHVLYGEDFMQEALTSLSGQVDQILVLWADHPWYGIREVEHECPGRDGPTRAVPEPIDDALFKAMQLNLPNVHFIKFSPPRDTFTMMHAAHEFLPREAKILIHTNGVDVIHYDNGITLAIQELRETGKSIGVMSQRWTWRDLHHEALMRSSPSGSLIYDMEKIGWENPTLDRLFNENHIRKQLLHRDYVIRLRALCWNVGYSYSYRTMKWRHEIRRAQVKAGLPYETEAPDWVERIWLKWPDVDERRLALDVVRAVPLKPQILPRVLRQRLGLEIELCP